MPVLVAIAAAYVVGVLGALLGGGGWWLSVALFLLGGTALLLWQPALRTALLVIAIAAIAGGAHARFEDASSQPPPPLAFVVGTHELSGIARSDALIRGTLARVDLAIDLVDGRSSAGGLRLTVPAREPIERGDRVTATVEVEPLDRIDDRDIADRLRAIGLHATAAFPEHWTVEAGNQTSLTGTLARLRRALVQHIERALPEPASGLAAGVLVGE